ncbi:MAG TPA: 3'-5' exonuclease [Cyclobacteriaceae bacterium]|nr:3'-5' exonuclease [Cyclobacteriaceae bacterium]
MEQNNSQQSEIRTRISNEELDQLPLRAYEGKVSVITEITQLTKAFKEIRQHDFVGFDTETKPTFKRGQWHPVALMQIATEERVYLIRNLQTGITEEVLHFMEDEMKTKAGIALRDDLYELKKLKQFKPKGFIDLGTLARGIGIEQQGLKSLAGIFLGFRISKSMRVTNWEAKELTEKQIIYAATDAWVCLELYKKLQDKADLRKALLNI